MLDCTVCRADFLYIHYIYILYTHFIYTSNDTFHCELIDLQFLRNVVGMCLADQKSPNLPECTGKITSSLCCLLLGLRFCFSTNLSNPTTEAHEESVSCTLPSPTHGEKRREFNDYALAKVLAWNHCLSLNYALP